MKFLLTLLLFSNPLLGQKPEAGIGLKPDRPPIWRSLSVAKDLRADDQKRDRFENLVKSRIAQAAPFVVVKPTPPPPGSIPGIAILDPNAPLVIRAEPKIIAVVRLSNGQVLLAWEGEATGLYDVEYSDDGIEWRVCGEHIPTIGGIGEGGEVSDEPGRSYRVTARQSGSDIPSDPTGGNSIGTGAGTVGGILTIHGGEAKLQLNANMAALRGCGGIALYIDGQFHNDIVFGDEGSAVYHIPIAADRINRGRHSAYAVITSYYETTPGPGEPSNYCFIGRTPPVAFTHESERLTGISSTENHINKGEPSHPTKAKIRVEYPSIRIDGKPMAEIGYTFQIRDEDGLIVRENRGVAGAGPGRFIFEWNGRSDDGSLLPSGAFYADFFMNVPGGMRFPEPLMIKNGLYEN